MSNFILDALGLFRRKRIVKKVENSDFIMLASTNVGNRSRETQGQMRSRLIRATDLGGTGTCPVVYLPPKIGENKGAPDPAFLIVDGENCNQYYKAVLDGDSIANYFLTIGTQSGKTTLPPPAGTYVIIIEYTGAISPTISLSFGGPEWPLGVAPIFSNTSGKVDILTIVSDGETSRGVATIGYNA